MTSQYGSRMSRVAWRMAPGMPSGPGALKAPVPRMQSFTSFSVKGVKLSGPSRFSSLLRRRLILLEPLVSGAALGKRDENRNLAESSMLLHPVRVEAIKGVRGLSLRMAV